MNTLEFSSQFDVLYNNITSNQAPGLDEYEKSVFLTTAQEEIIKNYFNPKSNIKQEGFDDSPKRQADFSSLIYTVSLEEITLNSNVSKFDRRSKVFKYPSNVFIVLNERYIEGNNNYTIVPISYEEYDRLMSKPYKLPLKNQAWRLITQGPGTYIVLGGSASQSSLVPIIELIANFKGENKGNYTLRYIKRPSPIILTDLSTNAGNMTINGEYSEMTCALPDFLHFEILQRAVELAKIAWLGDINGIVESGKRSE